jgi:glycosyltransferase EpsH
MLIKNKESQETTHDCMTTPKVSIVVPVFNAEAFLKQCVNSILAQTLVDIEVILINDGSTDESSEICDEFCAMDSRVKVFHQGNRGVSAARQAGLTIANGKFLMFVDADDWIDPETCDVAYSIAVGNNLDIVYVSYCREYGKKSFTRRIFGGDRTFYGEEEIRFLQRRIVGLINEELSSPQTFDSLSAMYMKLYKRDVVDESVPFIDLKIIGHHEDTLFNLYVLNNAKRVMYLERPFYHYRKRADNSISSRFSDDYFYIWQIHLDFIEKFLEKFSVDSEFWQAYRNRVCLEVIGLFLKEANSSNCRNFIRRVSYIKFILSQPRYVNAFSTLNLKFFPLHWKIFFWLCVKRKSFPLYVMTLAIKHLKSRF